MDRIYCNVIIIILKRVIKVAGYSRARSGITSGNCGFRARRLREYSYLYMMKNGNMNQLFLAKNKNEDSDLGWTADLKINLDKL